MPSVIVRDNESFERALKRFNKACEKSGLMREIRRRQFYEKPSQEKKRLRNAARRKQQKMLLWEKHNQIF